MSFSMKKLPGEPIILIDCPSDFEPATEMVAYSEELKALLENQTEPTFTITEIRSVKFDLDTLMKAANVSRSYAMSNLREPILVTDSNIIKMAMKGLDSEVYKHIKMPGSNGFCCSREMRQD